MRLAVNVALVSLALALLALSPVEGQPVAVVSLSRDPVVIAAEAGGSVIGSFGGQNFVTAYADRNGFVARLYAAGALVVLRAPGSSACGRIAGARAS